MVLKNEFTYTGDLDVFSLFGITLPVQPSPVPGVRKIYFNNKHTTIEWADGEKTTVGCAKDQEFDEYNGFAAAVLKRMFGSSRAAVRYMNERKVVQPTQVKTGNKCL